MATKANDKQIQPEEQTHTPNAVPLVSTPVRRALTPPNLLKRRNPPSPSAQSSAPGPSLTATTGAESAQSPGAASQQAQPEPPATTQAPGKHPNPFDTPLVAPVPKAVDEGVLPPAAKRPALATRGSQPAGWDGVGEASQFGAYMSAKVGKLRAQFAAERSLHGDDKGGESSNALQGVTVWVDGLTTPPRTAIRSLMLAHGGEFETYLTNRVTHVVADNLAAATQRRLTPLTRAPRALRVVTGSWVTTCVQRRCRVPEADYPVPGMTDVKQKSVASFFGGGKRKKQGVAGTTRPRP